MVCQIRPTCGISFLSADFAREIVPRETEDGRPRSNVCWTVHEVAGQPKRGGQRTRKKVELKTPLFKCLMNKWIPSWELTYPIKKALLKMIFLFPRWDMLVPWRVICCKFCREVKIKDWNHQLGAPHFLVHRIPPWSDPLRTVVSRLFFVAFHLDAQDSQTWESLTMDY